MSITYAANTYTQANEAGKTISSVASATDGITVTTSAAHGYSDGDFVEITGTTDYDGAWEISNASGSVFDIVNQYFGDQTKIAFGVTKTGTVARGDKDLNNLTGLTGVTKTTIGSKTYYDTGTNQIVINGAWRIAEADEVLINTYDPANSSADDGTAALSISVDGGILHVGTVRDVEGIVYRPTHLVIMLGPTGTPTAAENRAVGLNTKNAGQIVWMSCTINTSIGIGVASDDAGNMFYIGGQECVFKTRTPCQIRPTTTTNMEIYGVTYDGELSDDYAYFFGRAGVGLAQNQKFLAGSIFPRTGKPSPLFAATGLSFANDRVDTHVNTNATNANWIAADQRSQAIELTNVDIGTSLLVGPLGSDYYCCISTWQEVDINIKNTSGTNLQGVKVYLPSTDNGGRRTPTGAGSVVNYNNRAWGGTGFDEYTATSDASGLSGTLTVLTGVWLHDTTSGATTIDNFLYSETNTAGTDDYTIYLYKYGYLPQTNAIILASDIELLPSYAASDNLLISESTKATVDAYTNHDTAQKIYDAICSEFEDNYFTETTRDALPIGRAGEQILSISNRSLTVDSTASGRTLSTTLYTVQATTYSGGFDSNGGTGKATIQGATTIQNARYDSDIDYSSTATTLTNITCTGALDFDTAGTYTLDGCTVNEVTNSSGGTVILNLSNGTSITTNTGPNITLQNAVNVKVTALDTNGTPIEGARVYLEAGSGGPLTQGDVILNTTTNASGIAQDTAFNYSSNQPLQNSRVRKSSSSPYYKTGTISGTITSNGFMVTVVMIDDN